MKKKHYSVTQLNEMMCSDTSLKEIIDACAFIDICDCYEPVIKPPIDFLEECRKRQEAMQSPYRCMIERKIGNTWYEIETECDGNEPLTDKIKRLIFSDREVA